MIANNYKNWRVTIDSDHIAWAYLDKENAHVNTLNQDIHAELNTILDSLTADKTVKGIAFLSGKSSGLIAGADIEQFTKLKNLDEIKAFVKKWQLLYQRIADLSIPTVMVIEGFCLGGGLEFALACRYRIAENGPKTKLGLPEVLLGILPGWGGTVRLPALIGALQAMDLMLNGRLVDAKKAYKMGLVDAEVPKRNIEQAVRYYLLQQPEVHHPSLWQAATNSALVRPILAMIMRKKLQAKVKIDQYPAPYAILADWEKYGLSPQAYEGEIESSAMLGSSNTAKNLVRIFFLRDQLKALAKKSQFKAKRVHVIGAGTMGRDIATWCAAQGLNVTLQDREPQFLAPAIKSAYDFFKKKFKRPRPIEAAMDRLIPDPEGNGIRTADVIIEAIYENLEAKQQLMKHVEDYAKADAIIATNTSSIPLDEICIAMENPSRLVGIHFFNPVTKMMLVEVVKGKRTDEKVFNNAISFVASIDRLPLPVKSSPGFLVNRVLMPYLMECVTLLDEGVPAAVIDKCAKDFGMPMGPVELADTVGLDICLSVAENLTKHYGGSIPEKLREMVANKQLGKKTNQGFYRYKNGKPIKVTPPNYPGTEDITDRLILRLLNESVATLREGIVSEPNYVDAGMVFGTGFAPFRGGPMQYIEDIGAQSLKDKLQEFSTKYGERFTPDAGWGSIKAHD